MISRIVTFKSRSAGETKKVGRLLGRRLKPKDVVTLGGVRSEKEVASPTFVLIHEYKGRFPVYHLDWYRLARVEGPDSALAEECFEAPAVTLVEWPERGNALLPKERIEVKISHCGLTCRNIRIRAMGSKYKDFRL
jgi:tRNA threonylcarbamoyladenosine biosynthesis protein TsaE